MRKNNYIKSIVLACGLLFFIVGVANAQDSTFKPSGKLWGQVFLDDFYKNHSDSLARGVGQYSNGANTTGAVPAVAAETYPINRNELQYRRIYLGYNYDFAPKFSGELLLSSEKDIPGGDLSAAGSFSPFIKYANLRWKGIFKGSDLVVGQMATPGFATSSEVVWGYRSEEKTITDFLGLINSYDMGISLQGKFDPKTANFGYNVLLGDNTKASPVAVGVPNYKIVYGDVYGKFLDKKLLVDLYADYTVTARTPATPTAATFTQSRNIIKLVVGYTTPKFSAGVEGFITTLTNQFVATETVGGKKDTLSPIATGISLFVRGAIIPNKLGFFARYDGFNPNNDVNNTKYSSYKASASGYNDFWLSTEDFITGGLDFTPSKDVHIMPNVWYNGYSAQFTPAAVGTKAKDYDLVYRVTFAYTFGK
jgi:hypothetical protein